MQLNMLSLLNLVAAQNATALDCVKSCNNNVNCNAKCLGNPFPNAALINQTASCYTGCGADKNCLAGCNNAYIQGAGVPISNGTNSTTDATDKKASSGVVITASGLLFAFFGLF